MPSIDAAEVIQDALAAYWSAAHPSWEATLHVDEGYTPAPGTPVVLIADDGGTNIHADPWMLGKSARRISIRITAFADERSEARTAVEAAVDHIVSHRPAGIARIEDVSAPLITRDGTGAFLASITMPVIVTPITS